MTTPWPEKIHIVHPGAEINRVVEPVKKIKGDKIYIFTHVEEKQYYTEHREEIMRQLNHECPQMVIEIRKVNIYSMEDCMCTLTQLISSEIDQGNLVFVNISTGAKLFITALMISAQMFGAKVYYAPAVKYVKEGKKSRKKKTVQDNKVMEVGDPIIIPEFRLERPSPSLIEVLRILNRVGGIIKQKYLIKQLAKNGFISPPIFEMPYENADINDVPDKAQLNKGAYNKFRTQILEKLKEKKWIKQISRGRGARIQITSEGALWLKMFENTDLR